MPINIKFDALCGGDVVDCACEAFCLGFGAGGGATVGLVTGVCATSAAVGGPLVWPVAVYVDAVAGAAAGWELAVFAPEAFAGLGVDEAVGVDEGVDVELSSVSECVVVRNVFGGDWTHIVGVQEVDDI